MRIPHISGRFAAALIVTAATTLALVSSLGDAPIVDEVPHIGAGYSYVRRADMRLNPEHPPLVKDLAGLALLPLSLNESVFGQPQWTTEVNGQWTFGRALIFGTGNNADTVKNVARLPVLIFFVVGAWLIWKWSRERYGTTAALVATALFAFSPTIMAHARFVTTDMAAGVGVLAATYFFLRFLRDPSPRSFVWAALSLGLALLSKFNTVLLGPYFMLVALLYGLDGRWFGERSWRRAIRALTRTAVVGIVAFAGVVWPVYILHTWNYPPARQLADTVNILASQKKNPLNTFAIWAADKPVIRGAGHYALGLAMVQQRSAGGNTIYWLGQVVKQGGPWYFPIVYLLKEPLAWWILVSMAFTALAFHRRRHAGEPKRGSWWTRNTDEWVWLLWLGIYWTISIRSTLNIGVRHLLPVYPFAIMLVAGRLSILLAWLKNHDRQRFMWFSIAIAGILGWYTFESVRVFPSYLTYFNQIAGGPSGGYRYVVDSNLDWGQDIKRLSEWAQENDIRKISLDYFGWSDPRFYAPDTYVWTSNTTYRDARDFMRRNRTDGWIAISGTFLQNSNGEKMVAESPGNYRWLLDYEPVTVIGNSIFVWHITE